ncbi:hypothetical protein ACEWPM_018425 [Roseovarius sp. S4756]|uniref:hypothetical protein n=1 Tax=Roseovarius maritimus TaxID=3342637 RepID=UPI00372C3EBC
MKILAMGTSHTIALKDSWEVLSRNRPDLQVSYFVAPDRIFHEFGYGPNDTFGLLNPDTLPPFNRKITERMNDTLSISLGKFDKIIVVGLHFDLRYLLKIFKHYEIEGMDTVNDRPLLLSTAAFQAFSKDIIIRSPSMRLLQGINPGKTLVIPTARASQGVSTIESPTGKAWEAVEKSAEGASKVLNTFYDILAQELAQLGFASLLQPPDTISAKGLTLLDYSGGRNGLEKDGAITKDFSHLNTQYGERVWNLILEWIDA